jgi:hypothetical protein
MTITPERLREILAETFPSCGTLAASRMPDDATVEIVTRMTAAEWRELSPDLASGA